jgi:hypothetical protein
MPFPPRMNVTVSLQVTDDGIQPLCANLGRFKRLKKINLVSRSIRGVDDAAFECGNSMSRAACDVV